MEPASEKATTSGKEFKFLEFSFNLLVKFCHNYDACRSEFGRVGGLSECINRIELLNPCILVSPLDSNVANEFSQLVEIVCMSCKTASNRLRLRESGSILNLLKLQQKLRSSKTDLNKTFPSNNNNANIDFTLYNKLLAALCCFAHDQDSMQVLFGNGFIDSLLFYLDESIQQDDAKEKKETNAVQEMVVDCLKPFEKKFEAIFNSDKKKVSLRKLVYTSLNENSDIESRLLKY